MRSPTSLSPGSDTAAEASPAPISKTGIIVRVLVTLGVMAALLVGTLWGDDDNFPFGPFRMYSTTKDPNGSVLSTRMESVDINGKRLVLSGGQVGLRRAEIEGQLSRFRHDPELLGQVARAYHQRNPHAVPIVRIEIIVRHYKLRDGKPSGAKVDKVVTSWNAPKVNS